MSAAHLAGCVLVAPFALWVAYSACRFFWFLASLLAGGDEPNGKGALLILAFIVFLVGMGMLGTP